METRNINKRSLIRPIIFLCSVMAAGPIIGCSQALKTIPEELRGKYATTDPNYIDQYVELDMALITLGFAGGKIKYYDVRKVRRENVVDGRLLYSILCANDAHEEEFNLSFFHDSADEGIIHFKNKPHITWERQSAEY